MCRKYSECLKRVHVNGDANASHLNAIRGYHEVFRKICCLRDFVHVSEDYSDVWTLITEQMLTNVHCN
jgi:hypothetical protein